jgi:hypothetical protein
MKRVVVRRLRRFGEGVGLVGLFVVGACSSSDNGGGGFGDSGSADSGQLDGSMKSDTGVSRDSASDGLMLGQDTIGSDTTTSPDATTEAGFAFDGFGLPDGFESDAPICPDDDGDGFVACGPGCPVICDCDDHNSLVNPCAFDTNAASGDPVGSDGIDNDCDGIVDNLRVCDGPAPATPAPGVTYTAVSSTFVQGHDTVASDFANASDLCDNLQCQRIVSATWYGPNNSDAHRITPHMGSNFSPKLGAMMSFLSNGIADDDIDDPGPTPPLYRTGDGTDLGNTYTNPYPFSAAENTNPCGVGTAETATSPAVHDYTQLQLQIKAPINASGFSFMFNFFSEEYPVYVCAGFNDHFLALLTSKKYPGTTQISFDSSGHPIDVNNSFFTDCTSVTMAETAGFPGPGTTTIAGYNHTCTGALSLLNKTSYEIPYCCTGLTNGNDNYGSGATDWLTTTAPISAGETFTLSFVVFDEQDGILDSAVNLDSFRWTSTPVSTPVTAR